MSLERGLRVQSGGRLECNSSLVQGAICPPSNIQFVRILEYDLYIKCCDRLKAAAVRLNPGIPEASIDDAVEQVCDRRQAMAPMVANRELDGLIRDKVFELTLDLAINHQRWTA